MEALQQYQKQKYDLFLLDINLPDGNGLEFCKKIRETSETPVLFLTANDTEEDMLEGFGVGCDDYISKPFSIEVLRKKVLAVLKRTGIGKFRMKYRDLELDKEKCVVLMKGQEIHLTSTEYKLLLYLMENRGRVVTKAMLLEQLWDIDGEAFWNLQKTDFNYRYCYGGGICWCVLFYGGHPFPYAFYLFCICIFIWLVVPNGLSAQPL